MPIPVSLYLATENNLEYLTAIEACGLPGIEITEDKSKANVLLAAPPLVGDLARFTSLRWLQSTFAGVDALIKPNLRRDYVLTNVRGIFGQQMAEYVMGLGLHYVRSMPLYLQQQRHSAWQQNTYNTVFDKTIIIFGTGSIGQHLAGVAKAFGMKVIGINRTGSFSSLAHSSQSGFDKVDRVENAKAHLAAGAWVVCTLPSTSATRHLFNESLFAACQHVLFFNVGRGSCVDENALIQAVDNGNIQHAFLDVFEQEPLPRDNPLWSHPRVTVTPHIAAPSVPAQVVGVFADNLSRWQAGNPLRYLVNFDLAY